MGSRRPEHRLDINKELIPAAVLTALTATTVYAAVKVCEGAVALQQLFEFLSNLQGAQRDHVRDEIRKRFML